MFELIKLYKQQLLYLLNNKLKLKKYVGTK